jgi:hypothetical protein
MLNRIFNPGASGVFFGADSVREALVCVSD